MNILILNTFTDLFLLGVIVFMTFENSLLLKNWKDTLDLLEDIMKRWGHTIDGAVKSNDLLKKILEERGNVSKQKDETQARKE